MCNKINKFCFLLHFKLSLRSTPFLSNFLTVCGGERSDVLPLLPSESVNSNVNCLYLHERPARNPLQTITEILAAVNVIRHR